VLETLTEAFGFHFIYLLSHHSHSAAATHNVVDNKACQY